MTIYDILTLISAIGCALVAGLFFAFSVCVMRALGTLPSPHGIAAMQAINVVILNPVFLGVFVGTAAACAVVFGMSIVWWDPATTAGPLIGSLLYLIGSIVVTGRCNVPRNNALARVAPDSADGARLWMDYLGTWTFWNHVRTIASLLALVAFVLPRWLT
jgi:uncharacterized membrane protein